MSNFTAISTTKAPAAIGTYSQAVRVEQWVFLSGQVALDPKSGELIGVDDPQAQIAQVFTNLEAVAGAAGGSLANIVKLTVYLTDLKHFPLVNAAMAERFHEPYPARAAVGVAALPRGALVEVEAILHL